MPSRILCLAYAGALSLLTFYFLTATPIVPHDADLWFHLSHGRYIAEHGELPSDSYFSFISPPRQWADYSWLFQVTIHRIYGSFGYHGLILYGAAAWALFAGALCLFLFGARRRGEPLGYSTLLFALYLALITPNYLSVRPFTLSYALIPVFLYLLERRPKGVLLLLPLGILWVNSHGVEYPVMILIVGAYAIDLYVRRMRRALTRGELRRLALLAAVMGTVFLTPHGWQLLRVPFRSTSDTSLYIDELQKLELSELFRFSLSPGELSQMGAFNLLWILALAALIDAIRNRRLEIRHVILLAGGIYLLIRVQRLAAELALLTLPLIASSFPAGSERRHPIAARLAAALILLLVPLTLLNDVGRDRDRSYPLSESGLPHGVATFLKTIDIGGSIMNHPNVGGYFMWELFPRYRIFSNLEAPFIFSDADFVEVTSAYHDPAALKRFISVYDPSFIAVESMNPTFQRLIRRHEEYVPVFFDAAQILYLDREAHPQIASAFELRAVDPHALATGRLTAPAAEDRQAFIEELEKLHRMAPDVFAIERALAAVHNVAGRFADALPHAEGAIRGAPELADGHKLKGDALGGLGRLDEAAKSYARALRVAASHEKKVLYRALAAVQARLERVDKAYAAMKRGIDLFDPKTPFDDLFRLGALAALAGEPEEARRILELARLKVAPDDEARNRQLEQALAGLE